MDWDVFTAEVNADPVIAQRGSGSGFRVLLGWGDEQHLIVVHQGKVTDRHAPGAARFLRRIPVAVAEGIQLFGVSQVQASLFPHPAAQAELERPVA